MSLFDWIKNNYPLDQYPQACKHYIGAPKFLDYEACMKRLMLFAKLGGWEHKKRLSTLDIGSGPGHLGVIANYYGHTSRGIDNERGFMVYGQLFRFWNQMVICHNMASGTLEGFGRYDTITSILTNYGRGWDTQKWDQFADYIVSNHLNPGGRFILSFPGDKSLPQRRHLRKKATRVENGHVCIFEA